MSDPKAYECENCKSQRRTKAGESVPECCGRPMTAIPMDQCRLAPSAEHARFDDLDEPCDDGRAG